MAGFLLFFRVYVFTFALSLLVKEAPPWAVAKFGLCCISHLCCELFEYLGIRSFTAPTRLLFSSWIDGADTFGVRKLTILTMPLLFYSILLSFKLLAFGIM